MVFEAEKQQAESNESVEESSIKRMEDVEDLKTSAQILQRLHQAKDLEEQVLLLQRLASLESLDYATDFVHPDGRKATVRELIHEVYDKASTYSRTTRHDTHTTAHAHARHAPTRAHA